MIEIDRAFILRDTKSVISDFSARFSEGTISAIIGPNGSGKSTLLLALSGDLPLASGEISINGTALSAYSIAELAKLRSVVLQQPSFNLAFTVREILSWARSAGSTPISENEAMEKLEINQLAERKVTELSGGEKQRVATALAISTQSPILLLDEPFSAQDSKSKERIIELLKSLAKNGKTIIFVAHLPEAELSWCDQIIQDF